jgi:effector-binding domain-containing protein
MTTLFALDSAEVEVAPVPAVQLDGTCAADADAVSAAMGSSFAALQGFLDAHHLSRSAPPRGIYTAFGPAGTAFTVAIPIAASPPAWLPSGGIRVGELPSGHAVRFVHHGPYHTLPETYERIEEWLREHAGMHTRADWSTYGPVWEEYVVDQSTMPESELVTHIYVPIRRSAPAQ